MLTAPVGGGTMGTASLPPYRTVPPYVRVEPAAGLLALRSAPGGTLLALQVQSPAQPPLAVWIVELGGLRRELPRLPVVTLASAATGQPVLPLSRLLPEAGDARLHEEEVPREGARVTRAFQLVRWSRLHAPVPGAAP